MSCKLCCDGQNWKTFEQTPTGGRPVTDEEFAPKFEKGTLSGHIKRKSGELDPIEGTCENNILTFTRILSGHTHIRYTGTIITDVNRCDIKDGKYAEITLNGEEGDWTATRGGQ